MSRERGPAMYGDEEAGIPPEELYSHFDAENAIKMCVKVRDLVARLISQ